MRSVILGLKLRGSPIKSAKSLLATVGLNKGMQSLQCDEGNERLQRYTGRSQVIGHDSILKEISSSKTRMVDSRISAQKQLSTRRELSVELKQQETVQKGHEDAVLFTEEFVRSRSSGRRVLLGQDLPGEDNVMNHAFLGDRNKIIFQKKYPRPKREQRTSSLAVRPVRKYSISGKSESGSRSSSEGSRKSKQASNAYALNRQINILMETGYREEAYAVYEKIMPAGCKPDSYTYLHMIKGFCEGGELQKAQQLFRRIYEGEGLSCGRSQVLLYNAMVHGLGSAGLVKEALNLVEEMSGRGFLSDVYTYNSILHTLGKVRKVTEALAVFESMAGKGCAPDVVTYNSLINCLGKAGFAMKAYKQYEQMIKEGCLPDLLTFNTLLPILGKSGKWDLAMKLYKSMATIGCEPDVYTYTSLVSTLCRANRVDDALLISVEMTEKACPPNTVTFNSWLDGLCKEGRVVEAHLLYRKMLVLGYTPDRITYCILIDAYCKTGQFMDESFELLKNLLRCTSVSDRRTSEIVHQSFKKVGMLKQAKRIARNARAKKSHLNGLDSKVGRSLEPVLAC